MPKARRKMAETTQFAFSTAVRGFHVYRTVWTPHIGQCLRVEKEHNNIMDKYAIATILVGSVEDSDAKTVIGHMPRELSKVLWYFMSHGGLIDCEITGKRQRSPLVQGGLEIQCCL